MSQTNSLSSMKRITAVFHDADTNHTGYLSREDLKYAMIVLFGYKPSKYEVQRLMAPCSTEGMDLPEFMKNMSNKLRTVDTADDVKQTFMAFDIQCRGFLTYDDFKRVVSRVSPNLKESVLEAAFQEADRDGDGRVSYKDFEYMMNFDSS